MFLFLGDAKCCSEDANRSFGVSETSFYCIETILNLCANNILSLVNKIRIIICGEQGERIYFDQSQFLAHGYNLHTNSVRCMNHLQVSMTVFSRRLSSGGNIPVNRLESDAKSIFAEIKKKQAFVRTHVESIKLFQLDSARSTY